MEPLGDDDAMVKALTLSFRWRKMLDEGVYGALEDLAKAKASPAPAADAAPQAS
jgi:hypothetical protein